jgi:coenzyme F420-0:L-glutamate ligase/coenzyme F420-1:gamma-L-glutamate ligase
MHIQIIPITNLPIIEENDNLASMILSALQNQNTPLAKGDILVLSHVIVSRVEGKTVNLNEVSPSQAALNFADTTRKDPRLVEVVLRESRSMRRIAPGVMIMETKHGFVCANAGVDKSNVPGTDIVAPLPDDPDLSAQSIRQDIISLSGIDTPVIIADTHGRAHRDGEINVAIGASGFKVIRDRRGEFDLFGYEMKVKRTAVADELASAAELVIGQCDEGIPAAIIRGYSYIPSETSSATDLVRPREKDLFQ